MKIINIKTISFFIGLGLMVSCGGGSDSVDERKINLPGTPVLSLPLNGETCSDYTVVANNDTKAEISFSWATTAYATSYVLAVTQAGVEVANKEITTTSSKVVLDKGKTYSWTVKAKNKDGVNVSTTNSFTTPGKPIGNYVPYAAVINFSVNNSSSMASLSWTGKDEDSVASELRYNLTVTEDGNSIVSLVKTASLSVPAFTAKLNSTYVIKVETYDKQGSYSLSTINYVYK